MGVNMKNINTTLLELIIGILISTIFTGIIGIIITNNNMSFVLGLILGAFTAILLVIHMYQSLEKSLLLDEESAQKFSKKMAVLRMVVMGLAVVVALTFPKIFNIIAVLIGIMGLKISAYLQPITNKYISTKLKNKGR
jgi:MFS family permease